MKQNPTADDPDETEGRKLYRARADKLAQSQLAMATRHVGLATPTGEGKKGETK